MSTVSSGPREASKASHSIPFFLEPAGDANELGNQRHASPLEMGAADPISAVVVGRCQRDCEVTGRSTHRRWWHPSRHNPAPNTLGSGVCEEAIQTLIRLM